MRKWDRERERERERAENVTKLGNLKFLNFLNRFKNGFCYVTIDTTIFFSCEEASPSLDMPQV